MINGLASTKIFAIALGAVLVPCLAVAVNMPSGVSPEQVDITDLGMGQDAEPAPAIAETASWSIQVGAYADKDMAQDRLTRIAGLAADDFSHAAPAVMPFAWGSGRILYRARFTGFGEEAAKALCARLEELGESCFAVASEAVPSSGAIEAAAVPAPAKDRPLLDSSRLVSNADLSDMRGGFFVAGGAQFDFGASVRTLVNGQLALQTNLSWTPAGSVVQQLAGLGTSIQAQVAGDLAKAGIGTQVTGPSAPAGAALTGNPSPVDPPSANTGAATFVANSAPTILNTAPVVPPNSPPPGPGTLPPAAGSPVPMVLSGVQIQSPTGGATQVFANVTAGQIQNIILNSASNQTITQNTSVTLTIYNFAAWQQQLAQHALSAQLANEILGASGLGGGH